MHLTVTMNFDEGEMELETTCSGLKDMAEAVSKLVEEHDAGDYTSLVIVAVPAAEQKAA